MLKREMDESKSVSEGYDIKTGLAIVVSEDRKAP